MDPSTLFEGAHKIITVIVRLVASYAYLKLVIAAFSSSLQEVLG